LSASSTYNLKVTRVKYASSPPPSRLNIIFDLEMVLGLELFKAALLVSAC
jgi:hypothetical protein